MGEEVSAVVCGHTRMPFVRLVGGRLLVNPGSVGMPYGRALGAARPGRLRRCPPHPYDVDAACARVARGCAGPGAAEWADEYLRARNSAEDGLAAFGPLDGRPVRRGKRRL
ncbi:metallophosphatase family protein [Streptomyces xiaopingdaonensis]|uniref:metallophosphatase family protein n=1 Tax=Streptomyces xiaopingdaonensis TaxID=1565415 RepID=UPI0002E4726A|nr:metallophosphatase family protein [Streptomyces xiaopingdaonensis]